MSGDETIARELRENRPAGHLAINKTDDKRRAASAMEFYQLGFDPVVEISAEHGTGVGDLLDEIVKQAGARGWGWGWKDQRSDGGPDEPRPQAPIAPASDAETAVAIVGRPERRQVVARQPAAARGARARQRHAGHDARRDRRRCSPGTAAGSASSTRRACGGPGASARGGAARWSSSASPARRRRSPTPTSWRWSSTRATGATDQDAAIGGEADRAGRGIVIVANKWDLVKDRGAELLEEVRRRDAAAACGFSTTRRSCTSRR